MLNRNSGYNDTLDFCDQMEKEGRLYIIAPSPEFVISRTEKSFEKRLSFFNHGKEMMQRELEQVLNFLNTP
jgi:predicted patatin/cPLA2 family phospholipase